MATDTLDSSTFDWLAPITKAGPAASLNEIAPPILQRIEINWPHLIKRRARVLNNIEEMPAYLLLPEIHQLCDAAKVDNQRLMIDMLWHTGARISELLALTKDSFFLNDEWDSYVSLETLKKRGRPRGGKPKTRDVPITDERFIDTLTRYFATHKVKKDERLFNITRQAADKRIKKLVAELDSPLPIEVSCHTLRHSFAVNAVLHGEPLTVIRDWLGHSDINTTEIYTKVLSTETNHLMRYMAF